MNHSPVTGPEREAEATILILCDPGRGWGAQSWGTERGLALLPAETGSRTA